MNLYIPKIGLNHIFLVLKKIYLMLKDIFLSKGPLTRCKLSTSMTFILENNGTKFIKEFL